MPKLTDEEIADYKRDARNYAEMASKGTNMHTAMRERLRLIATIESKNNSLRECRAERDEIREENGRIRSKADAMLEAKEKTIVSMQEDIEEMHQRIKELEAENNSLVQRRICPVCGDTLDLVEHRHLRRTHD